MRDITTKNIRESEHIDWWTVSLYILFSLIGWINIYAASYEFDVASGLFNLNGRAGMQFVWICTSLVLALAIVKTDAKFFITLAPLFYILGILVLLVTLVVAPDIKGSRSWLVMGPIRLQPAEFLKLIIALMLANCFSVREFSLLTRNSLLKISLIILLPVLLVIMQKETGTALVYFCFILMLYREGLPGGVLFMGVASAIYFIIGIKFSEVQFGMLSQGEFITTLIIVLFSCASIVVYIKRWREAIHIFLGAATTLLIAVILDRFTSIDVDFGLVAVVILSATIISLLYLSLRYLKKKYLFVALFAVASFVFLQSVDYVFSDVMQPHQQKRIRVTLGMEDDLKGAGYHIGQSKIAIGSGALWGKGFLNGTQTKLKYVPEQATDFIFCTIGEEHGFVGSATLLFLYLLFLLRLIALAERQKKRSSRVYGYCVVSIFLFHLLVNIGMVLGITPVIGIPLPFFSYGGSSLWGFTILLFIFLRLDMSRKII